MDWMRRLDRLSWYGSTRVGSVEVVLLVDLAEPRHPVRWDVFTCICIHTHICTHVHAYIRKEQDKQRGYVCMGGAERCHGQAGMEGRQAGRRW